MKRIKNGKMGNMVILMNDGEADDKFVRNMFQFNSSIFI